MDKKEKIEREKRYNKLLIYLHDRIMPDDPNCTNSNFTHFIAIANPYLTPRQMSSNKFLNICESLKMGGNLGPDKLQLLKEVFTQERDDEALKEILKVEAYMQGKQSGGDTIDARRPEQIPVDDDNQPGGSRKRKIQMEENDQVDCKKSAFAKGKKDAGQFHKEEDNSFFYEDIHPYFVENFTKSVGVLQTGRDSHGTCFRVGDRYVMTAGHVVKKVIKNLPSCTVKFEMQNNSFKLDRSIVFRNTDHDVAILKISGDETLPEPVVLDKNDPPNVVDVFGYPAIRRLRVDMRCPVYTDQTSLDVDTQETVPFWTQYQPSFEARECHPPEGRLALHTSRSFEVGASGSPIAHLKDGKPVVTMMYQGGKPDIFYMKNKVDDFKDHKPPLNFRFEYGIPMTKVKALIEDEGKFDLLDELFSDK